MRRFDGAFMGMNTAAGCDAQTASSCPARGCASHSALMLDTMVMVSIFAILGLVAELFLAVLLILAGAVLIMLARIFRAGASERRLLSM